jgi:hypothetical protein
MPRLPDRFDLWVRRARECSDPARRLDYILGALFALPAWHFLNLGTRAAPRPATSEVDGETVLLVFSDVDRVEEIAGQLGLDSPRGAPPVISIPSPEAPDWCLKTAAGGALLINPGADAALVPGAELESFTREWKARDARRPSGFWIPHLTTEEEDFWQENGL